MEQQQQGKSLSKNLLYTPLEAYLLHDAAAVATARRTDTKVSITAAATTTSQSTTNPHPSQYLNTLKSVPKSLHETSLAPFLQSISHDHHSGLTTAAADAAKNNGSRPVSVKDVEDRIKQRAVTLVGGGINASLRSSTSTRSFPFRNNKHSHRFKAAKKRKRKEWQHQVQENCQSWIDRFGDGHDKTSSMTEVEFLREMNKAWNDYMYSEGSSTPLDDFTKTEIAPNKEDDSDNKMQRQFQQRLSQEKQLELVGAHVKIAVCNSHKAWAGRFGVLVGETTNTYRIAGLTVGWSSKTALTAAESQDKGHEREKNAVSTIVVPKQGTSLMLLLPMRPVQDGTMDSQNDNGEVLIPLSERTVCVTLKL